MGQYIKIETKRLLHTLPGFLSSLLSTVLLALLILFLAGDFLPEVLEVKPFRIGLCVEGSDMMSDYVKNYVQQMESTEDLVEFQEMERGEIEKALQEELTACILIPERTAQSIMDGTNIPIQVFMGAGVDNAERYLQKRLLTLLTECGAVMIDVPQAETLLLYEMQVEDPQELGMTLDLFHFGLVTDRENWFEKEMLNAFGSAGLKEYYLAAGLSLVLLFWGLGCGSFFREQGNLPLLLERRRIPLFFQQGVKQALFIGLYLAPVLLLAAAANVGGGRIPALLSTADMGKMMFLLLLCSAMLALQCSFFFQLAPTAAGGIVCNGIWALTGFFGAGGVLPSVFLPKTVTGVCGSLPAGICMELLLQMVTGKGNAGGKTAGIILLWCLLFGLGGQLVFYRKQWSKKRK
mgnify:CR=1 FL=1